MHADVDPEERGLYLRRMTKAHDAWTVLEHGSIRKLAENLWWVDGALPRMTLRRTMTIVRLGNGELVIHNGIVLREGDMREIEAWGTPAYLVVPNGGHRLDAPAYKKRYPQLKVIGPKGQRARIEEVVPLDATYEDVKLPDDTVRFEMLHGVDDAEGAMIVKSPDGVTLVLNDAMFNMDKKRDPLGWFFTTVMGSAPGPRVTRLAKWMYVKDKKALRADFERFAEIPGLTRVIVAHEKIASGAEAKAALKQAATYL